jgi:ABC-2 type transport system permease protein
VTEGFSMRRTLAVAGREFRHTALTKGFIIGAIGIPALLFAVIPLIPRLMRSTPPPLEGRIAVVDRLGHVVESLQAALAESPERQPWETREEDVEVRLEVEAAPPDTSIDGLRAQVADESLRGLLIADRSEDGSEQVELLVPSTSSPRHTRRLEEAGRKALVRARVTRQGQDFGSLQELMKSEPVRTSRISPQGEQAKERTELRTLVPMGFMLLLWVTIFTSANYLLTSTIEEKSSRVMEVLLSATSPMELLAGKLLGQAGVSLVMLLMYGGVGLAGLGALAMLDVVRLTDLLWLAAWFPVAYFMVAVIMAGVGSAVNDLRDAQSLVGPALLALMVPMVLWLPIVENPHGAMAVIFSFIPPASPFVTVLRLTAVSDPVPAWQGLLALAVAILCTLAMLWAGARIFRVGALMQGKTPTPRELLRWIRVR